MKTLNGKFITAVKLSDGIQAGADRSDWVLFVSPRGHSCFPTPELLIGELFDYKIKSYAVGNRERTLKASWLFSGKDARRNDGSG